MRLDHVWFRYAHRAPWALRAVDVTVRPGDTIVVLGRNGAGKSTLLQLAAGVLRPNRGAVRDRPAVVGWVPERFPADQPFTAGEYLARMAAVRGLRDTAAVDHWIDRLLLREHAATRLAELSKGTAQKVGLAQALLVPPGLLVLDEPWEGLDAAARTLVPEIVAEVTAAGGAVLVSDHRGEIAGLTGATHWTVEDATVRVAAPVHASAGRPSAGGQIRESAAGAPLPADSPGGPVPADGAGGTAHVDSFAPADAVSATDAVAPAAGLTHADGFAHVDGFAPADGFAHTDEVIVEVAVPRGDADTVVAHLREAGHRVVRVRPGPGADRMDRPDGAAR